MKQKKGYAQNVLLHAMFMFRETCVSFMPLLFEMEHFAFALLHVRRT
jgi:hypothetical protein